MLLLRLLHHVIHVTINVLFDELPAVTPADDEEGDVGTLEAALRPSSPGPRTGSRSPRNSSMQQSDGGVESGELSVSGLSGQLAEAVEDAANTTHQGRSGVLSLFKELHDLLLAHHCRENSVVLREIVSSGISRAGVVWDKWPRPFEVRGYIVNLLLHCVKIHADTVSTVPSELKRVLGAALEVICGVFREEVDMISDSLSLHSAEQLNLELNFVTTTLEDFETAVSAGRAKMCRTLLSKKRLSAIDAMDRKEREQQAMDDANLQQVHEAACVANEIMFSCFRTEPLASLNNGAVDAAAAAAVAAKTGAERRRSEQRRLGGAALASAAVVPPPGNAEGERPRPTKAKATVGNAFIHTRPNRTSLASRQSQTSASWGPNGTVMSGAAAEGASAKARAERQNRLRSSMQGSREGLSQDIATSTFRASGTRPRTPPGRGIIPENAPAMSSLSRGVGTRTVQSARKYSSSQHVKPRQPVLSSSAAPAGGPPPSNYGSGLTLSPASVAKSAATAARKPPSPPASTAPSRGGSGMAMVASAATLTGAARVRKARRRPGGDV